jgi:hypothetical protein
MPRHETSNCSSLNEFIESEVFSHPLVPVLDFPKGESYSRLPNRSKKSDSTEYYRWAKQVTEKVSRPFPWHSGSANWVSSRSSINSSIVSNKDAFKKKRRSNGSGGLNSYKLAKMSKSTVRVRNRNIKEWFSEYYPKDTTKYQRVKKSTRVNSQEHIKALSLNIHEELTNLNIFQNKPLKTKKFSIPSLVLDNFRTTSRTPISSCQSKIFIFIK